MAAEASSYEDILATLTPEQRALEARHRGLCEALGSVGWEFAGSGLNIGVGEPGHVSMTFELPSDVGTLTWADARQRLAIMDDRPTGRDLLPGWALSGDLPEDSQVAIHYDGPVDTAFVNAVRSMLVVAVGDRGVELLAKMFAKNESTPPQEL